MERAGGERGRVITRRGLVVGALALAATVGAGQPSIAAAQGSESTDADDSLNLKVLLAATRVELKSEGVLLGSFDDVISVAPESTPVTYLDDDGNLKEDPELRVPPSIVLGDGTAVRELRAWFNAMRAAEKPASVGRPATLVLYDGDDQEIMRFRLMRAFPAALRLADGPAPDKLDVQRLRMVFRDIKVVET